MIDFNELIQRLKNHALLLEAQDRRRFIRVVGIDATPPKSFRDKPKTSIIL